MKLTCKLVNAWAHLIKGSNIPFNNLWLNGEGSGIYILAFSSSEWIILGHILHEPQSNLARLSLIKSLRYPWFSFQSFLLDSFPWGQFSPKTTCIQTFVSGSAFGEIQAKTAVLCSDMWFQKRCQNSEVGSQASILRKSVSDQSKCCETSWHILESPWNPCRLCGVDTGE